MQSGDSQLITTPSLFLMFEPIKVSSCQYHHHRHMKLLDGDFVIYIIFISNQVYFGVVEAHVQLSIDLSKEYPNKEAIR